MKTETFKGHTPGPWSVDWETGQIESNNSVLGMYYGAQLSEDDEAYKECKANAELIASAPTLLKEREELIELANKCKIHMSEYQKFSFEVNEPFKGILYDIDELLNRLKQPQTK